MRKPRIHVQGGISHVMLRGNNRQRIFYQAQDEKKFFDILENVISKYDGKIHGYCLMPNHVHLVIEVGIDTISKMIQCLAGRYALYFNKKYERKGHLFQARFKSILINADQYFLILIRYIHQNPLRANLISSLKEPWPSSFLDYFGTKNTPWLTQELVWSYFNNQAKNPREKFNEFMMIKQNKEEYLHLFDIKNLPEHQTTTDFTKTTYISENKYRITPLYSIDDILIFCEKELEIPRDIIVSKAQNHTITQARLIAISLAFTTRSASLKELATYFKKDYSNLSRQVNRVIITKKQLLSEMRRKLYNSCKT